MKPSDLKVILLLIVSLSGCAHRGHLKGEDPHQLLKEVCRVSLPKEVSGNVAIRANSEEVSGQFPASLRARKDRLDMEVTDLFGATRARIRIRGKKYEIKESESNGRPARQIKGSESWGGIPLRWASLLFMGGVPCPSSSLLKKGRVFIDGRFLVVSAENEKFEYQFKGSRKLEDFRISELKWSKKGFESVTLSFDEYDWKSGYLKRWKAESDRGSVKVLWRNRSKI